MSFLSYVPFSRKKKGALNPAPGAQSRVEEEEMKTKAQPLQSEDVKRSREDKDFVIDEAWLLDTFKGVVKGSNASTVLKQLQSIDAELQVGGLVAIGLAEAEEHAMEKAGVPFVVRVEIKRFAKERTAAAASTTSTLPAEMMTLEDLHAVLDGVKREHPLRLEDVLMLDVAQRRLIQQALLGDFYSPEHDWKLTLDETGWIVDMIQQPSLIGDVRPLAARLDNAIRRGGVNDHFVIGLSGSGKTSAVADLAKTYFVIYFQCNADVKRVRYSKWFDEGFMAMVDLYRAKMRAMPVVHHRTSANRSEEEKTTETFGVPFEAAKHASKIELLSRLCQLWQLMLQYPTLSPENFFAFQHSAGDRWVKFVRGKLENLPAIVCDKLAAGIVDYIRSSRPEHKLLVVVDEVQAGLRIETGQFAGGEKSERGILYPMIRAIRDASPDVTRIYMGTGVSVELEESVSSSVGKDRGLNLVYQSDSHEQEELFPTVSVEVCRRFFRFLGVQDLVPLDKIQAFPLKQSRAKLLVEIAHVITDDGESGESGAVLGRESFALDVINNFVVGSRFRTLTRFVSVLCEAVVKDLVRREDSRKQRVARFNYAAAHAVNGMISDLATGFRQMAKAEKGEKEAQVYNNYLLEVWTAVTLMEGRVHFLRADATQDLIKLGIGFGYGNYVEEGKGYYRVTEPIVVAALQRYMEQESDMIVSRDRLRILDGMAELIEKHGMNPSRGTLFEDIVFAAARRVELQGKLLSELPFIAQPLSEAKCAAPPWLASITYAVRHVVRMDAAGSDQSTAATIRDTPNVLVAPETTARFDGMVLLGPSEGMTFAITMWASTVPSSKMNSQRLSTDPAKAYFLTDGSAVNSNCTALRAAWEAQNLHKVRAVRIHVAVPGATPRPAVAEMEGEHVLVHIDAANASLLLGKHPPELYDVLAAATRTKREAWDA